MQFGAMCPFSTDAHALTSLTGGSEYKLGSEKASKVLISILVGTLVCLYKIYDVASNLTN